MSDFATSSGHWYAQDGTPCYTVIGKNGKERNTTLRDARELQLVPSVTTIIRCAAAPQLEKWKRNQVLLAALTLPRLPEESEEGWLARVEQDWQQQGRKAAERGEQIHGGIERHFRGEAPDPEVWEWVKVAKEELERRCGNGHWRAERSFAHPIGYGGKVDLHSTQWVIDFKTKDDLASVAIYDEHAMQASAYRRGLGFNDARCAILFIDRNRPEVSFVEIEENELTRGLSMFNALLAYWKAKAGIQ